MKHLILPQVSLSHKKTRKIFWFFLSETHDNIGKLKSTVIFQFKINLHLLGFREKITERLLKSQIHIKQISSYCQTVDIFIYFLTFKIPSSKYWAYGVNPLHISQNRKNMSVSTAEQTDFYKIEPVVYYRFKQGQVVELFA